MKEGKTQHALCTLIFDPHKVIISKNVLLNFHNALCTHIFFFFPQGYESDKFNFCSATNNERRKLQLPAKFWPSDLTPSSRKNAQTEQSGTLGKNQSYISSMNLDKPTQKKVEKHLPA